MKEDELKKLFKKAAEIAQSVPEPLREAAFNRAVDALLGVDSARRPTKISKKIKPKVETIGKGPKKIDHDPLLVDLNRTAYPQIREAPRVLERALFMLRIAKDKFNIDGLTSTRIAKVLTEKFRLKTTRQAVQQALNAAGDMVNNVPLSPKGTLYRIMDPGEVYLDTEEFKVNTKSIVYKVKKRYIKKVLKKNDYKKSSAENKKGPVKKKPLTSLGPKPAINQLLIEGYFDNPRRIGDIQAHLKHAKGLIFKVTTISAPLLRMVRDQQLSRTPSKDGQYEYKRP